MRPGKESKEAVVVIPAAWILCYVLVFNDCIIITRDVFFIHKGNSLQYLPFSVYLLDTVFFHLPPRNGNGATVYGISCYRQIEAKVGWL